ncbi:unnamed protein product [Jaminaea pallidilutea]
MAPYFKSSSPWEFPGVIDLTQPSLYVAAASIAFNPTFWNIVAQNEYHNKTISRILNGNRYLGCYLLAATIFSLGILRDHLYMNALKDQPIHPLLTLPAVKVVAAALVAAGNIFVISSMWALGVTGTYLGDYFGILMDDMVTGFPFNVMGDPMYWGSSMSFAGVALWFGKPAGLFLTVLVVTAYTIALRFEGPFTNQIYEDASKSSKKRQEDVAKLQAVDGPAHRTRASTGTPTASPAGTPSKRGSRKGKSS